MKRDWDTITKRAGFVVLAAYCTYVGGTKRDAGTAGNAEHQFGEQNAGSAEHQFGEEHTGNARGGTPRVILQSPVNALGLPFRLTNGTAAVQTVLLSTQADAADLATLVDAPETARIRIAQEGGVMPDMTAMEQSLTAQFKPAQWMVAAIGFADPVALEDLLFGDTAGRPDWERAWQGEIAYVVCLDGPCDNDLLAGVASYIALQGKFGGYPATPAQRKAALAAGLKHGVDWATVIIVR